MYTSFSKNAKNLVYKPVKEAVFGYEVYTRRKCTYSRCR